MITFFFSSSHAGYSNFGEPVPTLQHNKYVERSPREKHPLLEQGNSKRTTGLKGRFYDKSDCVT